MKIRVLGSGTSSGVPVPGCHCAVCLSTDKRNRRLRTSLFIENHGANLLIDTSPDLRYQALREGISRVDAVLYTHVHADHVFGIDDLRSFNFINRTVIDCYASEESVRELELRFSYAFYPDPSYLGGAPPNLRLHTIRPGEPLSLCGMEILPLRLLHGNMEVLGYRIGAFAYLTDCSFIPDETAAALGGLEILVIDGLRIRPHATHFTHAQAVEQIERLRPGRSYLTHISHEVDHETSNAALRGMSSRPIELAYDGLTFDL